jgi:predicted DNA-binding protein (MmcQ/YjbR family)
VGREIFQRLFGFPPAGFADHAAGLDFTELDRVLPHPVYARQGWVSVLTPGPHTSDQVRELISHAHRRARDRYRRAGQHGSYSA